MNKRFTKLIAALALLVFMTPSLAGWGQTRDEVVDVLVASSFAATNTTYTDFSNVTFTSDAVYAGNSAKTSNGGIQLRSKNSNSGIVSTDSGGTIHSVAITVESGSNTLDIYGKNTAYTSASDLYNSQTQGTKIGSISATGTVNLGTNVDQYAYIGIRSNNGAIYLTDITVTWTTSGGTPTPTCATPTITPNGGSFLESQEVNITCGTDDADIHYSTTSNEGPWSDYSQALTLTETTTVWAYATKDGMEDSQVAEATFTKVAPLDNIAALTAKTEAGTYYVTLNNAVVTYVSGGDAYIQDASGAVLMHKSGHGLTAGQVFNGTAQVSYQLYKENPQIVDLTGVTPTTGTVPEPTAVAQSAWNLTFNNVLSQYFQITGATLTKSGNYYYVELGDDNIQLYKASGAVGELDLTKTYSFIGFPMLYNTTKEFKIFADPVAEASTEPSITVTPATINAPFAGAEGTLTVTYENITTVVADVYFCNAAGTVATYDWVTASVNETTNNVDYLIEENEGEARTAYLKVWAYDDDLNEVYSDIVTINQDEYVAPTYAELPFGFNNGKAAIEETDGLSQEGLGSDYSTDNTKLKFDHTGDWLLLQFNERPGTLTFDIKNNSFSGGTFTVQTSEDGVTYTDLETYTEITGTQNEEFTDLGENVRYIKWIYTNKSSGNVGLGNIALAKYVAPVPAITVESTTITATAAETEGTLNVTYTAIESYDINWYESDGTTAATEPEWISTDFNAGGNVTYVIEENTDGARTAYFKVYGVDADLNDVYSELVTIRQAAPAGHVATGNNYELCSGELVEGDYLIVYDGKAMNNVVVNDRLQYVGVTPNNDVIVMENAEAIWHIAPSGEYWTIYSADADAYAASTGAKNKAQMLAEGTDDKALWTVSGTEIYEFVNKQNATNNVNANLRNNGEYGFACYAEGTGGALSLYKRNDNYTPAIAIKGYGEGEGGYYLIASPVSTTPEAAGMITDEYGAEATPENATYDLYSFDQAQELEWINYRQGGFNTIDPGKGYLYANKNNVTLTFAGVPSTTNSATLSLSGSGEFAGWNLVGNPFSVPAYIGNRAYYRIGNGGADIVAATAGTAIDVMEGVFVIAAQDGEQLAFSTTAAKGASVAMNVTRNRGTAIDRAIVRFDEGQQLPKFQLNPESTKLYIAQGNKDYAIVRSAAQGEMPVSFRAAENGTYTLSIETENVEMDYLHLIDNMTGMDIDLLQTPSYSFEAKTSDYVSRFRLVFSANGIDEQNAETFAFFNGSEWMVSNLGEATLQVVDVMGRVLSTETISGNAELSLDQPAGVYMLRLINGNDVKVQKVIVK